MKTYYKFPDIWRAVDFEVEIGMFTRCEYGTLWNDPRIVEVEGTQEDLSYCAAWAKQLQGREIPQP